MSRRRRRRIVAAAVLAAAAALAISGCQSRLGAAALVGQDRISDDELQAMVSDALDAPGVRNALPQSSYKGDLAAYRRSVLGMEVERVLAEAAARKAGVTVDENKVTERYRFYEKRSGSAGQFAADLAAKDALSPALFRELVRTEVIESEIGYQTGGARRPTEAELRRLYEQYAGSATTATLSLIQVRDAATARQVLARVQRAPDSFAEVAKEIGGQQANAAEPQEYVQSRLPADLSAKLAKARPGDIFSYSLPGGADGGYFVIKFGGVHRPTLESSRPQLESQSVQQAASAGQRYVAKVAGELGVKINPRYGAWDGKRLSITDFVNPAVRPTATPSTPAPGSVQVPPGGAPSSGGTG